MSNKWTKQDIPDMTGKIVIITGANSGLGLESTKALAAKGATVVMACRNLSKAEEARAEVLAVNPAARLDVMALDNASLASVRAFADAFKARYDRLDILLNNAGVMAIPRALTEDGFEMQLGVNHLAHFALTGLLLDVITATPKARVHSTSSSAAFMGAINLDDLMGEKSYGRWTAYGQSKLANAAFATELNRRLQAAGHSTIANSSHPGFVMTNLQTTSMVESGTPLSERIFYGLLAPVMAQDVNMGVLPQLYGSTAPDAKGGVFYGPKTLRMRGYPAEQKCNDALQDADLLNRFWEASEELTGVRYLD
ncbi:MAG: oxidoreductase [Caldilinea sp.]|nr:SDR family oxidoreductase [Caldilineaceae bacterium]MCB9117483.1 SDR family oxidoreductase [Caldilineaceae bacterium]MCB9123274.1 SDR family oxidoreductase [Caldilineaceae bacterium]MCO5212115.1 oxidoreductase [Caldilinea sp.]MCW5843895.1 SDR family oxidoreductase [Caldilinea sp.]